jgi:hypothetical protein
VKPRREFLAPGFTYPILLDGDGYLVNATDTPIPAGFSLPDAAELERRLLAIDSSDDLRDFYGRILKYAGMEVRTVDEVVEILGLEAVWDDEREKPLVPAIIAALLGEGPLRQAAEELWQYDYCLPHR